MKRSTATVLMALGLTSFLKNADGKEILTEEQKDQMKKVFGEDFTNDYVAEFEKSGPGGDTDPKREAELMSKLSAHVQGVMTANADFVKKMEEMDKKFKSQESTIGDLTAKVNKLADSPETDPKTAGVKPPKPESWTPNGKDTHLFGVEQPFMAIDEKHPYNQRAYSALCKKYGIIVPVREASSTDYTSLKADLGEFYRVRFTDRIQSFITEMPSLKSIFPVQSNLQDQAVIPNIFSTEFSQPANPGSTFANLVKGSFKFQAEVIKMYGVKIAHLFENMEEVEKTWIGYVNREGSQVIKWSLLEYLYMEVAKRAHNEREVRYLRGVYKTPTLNVPGSYLNATDGLLKRLKIWISEYKIKPFSVGAPSSGNMVTYLKNMTALIPEHVRMTGQLMWYMSTDMYTMYCENYRLLYGENTDFKGNIAYVMDYPMVRIKAIPGMSPSQRMFCTFDGNFFIGEDKPGEYFAFNFEQQDWTLKMWSDSKETIWAQAVGQKFASAADMPSDYSSQLIWCNDVDEPADYYINMDVDDTTPSVANHTSLVSVANTASKAITNIDDATVGREIRLKRGPGTYGITIAASGNFSLLPSAWNPEAGDVIHLVKRSDGKFFEVKRVTASTDATVILADDTTPDVSGNTSFITSANSGATAITTLDNAEYDVDYTIYGGSNTNASTIANSGNFSLTDAMTLGAGTYIVLRKSQSNDKFYEISRG